MGESVADRASLLKVLATLDPHPESVPINALVAVAGTPMEKLSSIDSPKNIVGRIPNEFLGSTDATGWYFGHLESPIKGEGNVFQELPNIANAIKNGDIVYIHLIGENYQLVYEAYSSEEIHEDDLIIFNPGLDIIKLVTCSNRPFYDYRFIVSAKLIGEIKK